MGQKPEDQVPKNPTIGPSYEIDRKTNLTFLKWLPSDWIPRKEEPDVHMDYSVEEVRNGEPTGLSFRVQIKGREGKNRRPDHIVEQFKTKHLSYYLKCPVPVYVFVIDPKTEVGYWLFIQRYLRSNGVLLENLDKQATMKVAFDPNSNLENKALFFQDLRIARNYMRDAFPGSPVAAVLAKQRELEALDSRFNVKIEAHDTGILLKLHPKAPETHAALKFSSGVSSERLRAFLELGEPLTVRASDIVADSPIMERALKEVGDTEVTLASADRPTGCVQLIFHEDSPYSILQINGRWRIAPRRLHFEGFLEEAPLALTVITEADQPGVFGNPTVTFGFDFSAWTGQTLLSLAYFDDLERLIQKSQISVRCLVRGQELYKGQFPPMDFSSEPKIASILEWLKTCRKVARFLNCNPVFPNKNNLAALETDEMYFLAQLVEHGKHEQPYAGETFEMTGNIPATFEPSHTEAGMVQMPGQFQEADFLGQKVTIGPLTYTWTDLRLTEVKPDEGTRQKLTWKGAATSVWRVELSSWLLLRQHAARTNRGFARNP